MKSNEKVTTASQIRGLYEMGYSIKDIAESLNIRYQHAYNTIHSQVSIKITTVKIDTENKTLEQCIEELTKKYNEIH